MKRRILVIDDDAQIRESLCKVLRAEGYEVALAADGLEGTRQSNEDEFDLVLLDLNLPDSSGWDIFGMMTSSHPFVPVIVITARQNQRDLAMKVGVGALMEKPLDVPLLLKTIDRLVGEEPQAHLRRLAGSNA
jgi:DNA-binding response OmpR family regulator